MIIHLKLNGKDIEREIADDTLLIDFLRDNGCLSVKRGCETSSCGLCTVMLDNRPILSCSTLAARVDGKQVLTLEGLQKEAAEFGAFLADEGAEQCGFCSPGIVMSVLAMTRELDQPDDEAIAHYLSGNLCRCTGYMGQKRAIRNYLNARRANKHEAAE
ncbi:MAG: 2Fe-2S iron-sulfur cluster-binding protein [Clostridiaceae bacterium]